MRIERRARPVRTRSRRAIQRRRWLGLLPLLGVAACAGETGAYFVAETAPPPAQIRRILVVPMNFDATPPAYLAEGTEILQAEVLAHLQRTGRQVARVRLGDVHILWKRLAAEAGGLAAEDGGAPPEERVEAVRSRLVRRLAEAYPADVIAMPTLVVREGWYTGMSLHWDGVTRPVPGAVEREGQNLVGGSLRGRGPGTSLRMTLYTPDGKKCFERYAGLEPVLRISEGGFGSVQNARAPMSTRTDLFRDRGILQEGVALSLTPALGSTAASE